MADTMQTPRHAARNSTCLPAGTLRGMDLRSASTTRFNIFYVVFNAKMVHNGQTCCLKWNLRIVLSVRVELSTLPSRRASAFSRGATNMLFSMGPSIPVSQDASKRLIFYMRYTPWDVRCYIYTRMSCKRVHNRRQPRTSFEETK
jgi:hypothetical protein